jgi:DNA-binding Xre family transcriptional regulator
MSKFIKSNLATLRFNKGRLSQKQVSEATGIGQKTLSALETGSSKGIEFNTLLRLCEFFDCSPNDLLLIEEESIEYINVSEESRTKAKNLVALGLQAAMQNMNTDPEMVWAQFDAVRARMQQSAEKTEKADTRDRKVNRA